MARPRKTQDAASTFHAASQDVIDKLREKYGAAAVLRLSDGSARSAVTEVIPTRIDVLDYHVFGCGGLPVKRMLEVFSEEGKGKTSFLYWCLAAAQRIGGIGIMTVTEEVDEERAAMFGVDLDKLIILQPDYLEQVGDQAKDAIEMCTAAGLGPILWGWDSVAATPTRREIEEGIDGKDKVSDRAKHLSKFCRVFGLDVLQNNRVCAVVINQVRENIGVMFGDKLVTPGGKALKFLAAIRLGILGGKKEDDDEGDVGAMTPIFRTAKNKVGKPFREARVRLDLDTGWDNQWSTIEFGMENGKCAKGAHRRKQKAYDEVMAAMGWVARPSGLIVPADVDTEPPT